MSIGRREFVGAAFSLAAVAAYPQETPAIKTATLPPPTRIAKVEKLFKAPDIHPNALECVVSRIGFESIKSRGCEGVRMVSRLRCRPITLSPNPCRPVP